MSAAIKKLDYFHMLFYVASQTFRYSEINTLYIKNTDVMGKVSTQLGSKHRYPSTRRSYSSRYKRCWWEK